MTLSNWLSTSEGDLYFGADGTSSDNDFRVYGYNAVAQENQYVALQCVQNGTAFNTANIEAVDCNLRLRVTGGGHCGINVGTSLDWSEFVVRRDSGSPLMQIRGTTFDFTTNPTNTVTLKKDSDSATISVENGPLILSSSTAEVQIDSPSGDVSLNLLEGSVSRGAIQMQDAQGSGMFRFKNRMSNLGEYVFHSADDGVVMAASTNGVTSSSISLTSSSLQITFGAEADPPSDTLTPDAWVSVRVGQTDYRLPLYSA